MTRSISSAALCCALCTISLAASAQDQTGASVQLPLAQYELLTRRHGEDPTTHAFSDVTVDVQVADDGGSAEVTVTATVRVIGTGWALIPLPAAGALASATADGAAAELVAHPSGLAWPIRQAAGASETHQLSWTYRADPRRWGDGRVLAIPTPPAAGSLSASVPGSDPGVTVIGASSVEVTPGGDRTQVQATLPASGSVQLAWRAEGSSGFTLSRAHYRGEAIAGAIRFVAELTVDLAGPDRVLVPLFPAGIAIEDVLVDRVEAPIAVRGQEEGEEGFAVPVSGRGRHRIVATFQVPIAGDEGLPSIDLSLVPTPVCRFELRLPGERDVTVDPAAAVVTQRSGGRTVATFHVPMSSAVSIQWSEAVPEDAEEVELHAAAEVIHVVRPDEGVLSFSAFASWEITRGAMSRAELELPAGVQVTTVSARGAGAVVSDWRIAENEGGRVLTAFLDRAVSDRVELEIRYERAWPVATRTAAAFDVPMLHARGAHRQRGMVALLSGAGLTLEPREEEHLTRVGDNLLPATVRDALSATVAHTFRYLDELPRLVAIGATREPEPARFDAQVDTLISLGEVSTGVATHVEIEVKSGALDVLHLALPAGLSLLEVSAPSLRRYTIEEDGGRRRLRIELTQPMEGRLTVEVLSERITGQERQLGLPFLRVEGAEVERGRIAVEARAAFQFDVASADRLSPIDPGELPEHLLLRTDNPILHAFRYAQASPEPRLAVRITRHAQIETPQATVEDAAYRTLYTGDGVAVTTARFMVKNRRQQFLRVMLPEGSEVWSARIDGRVQQPARESGSDEDEPVVLLNIVSAAEAFPVELVYATEVGRLGAFGRVAIELPRVDVVVTRSRWELVLPDEAAYMDPDTAMTFAGASVTSEGRRFVFTQMYAGRDDQTIAVSIPYAAGWGRAFGLGLSALGAILFWLGLLAFAVLRLGIPIPASMNERLPIALATYRANETAPLPARLLHRTTGILAAIIAAGALILVIAHAHLGTAFWPALVITLLVAAGAIGLAIQHHRARKQEKHDNQEGPPATPPAVPAE